MSCKRKRKREFFWHKMELTNCQNNNHTFHIPMTVSVFVKKYRGTFTFLLGFLFIFSTNICSSNCQQIQNHKHTNPVRIRSFQLEPTICQLCVQWERCMIFKLKANCLCESEVDERGREKTKDERQARMGRRLKRENMAHNQWMWKKKCMKDEY